MKFKSNLLTYIIAMIFANLISLYYGISNKDKMLFYVCVSGIISFFILVIIYIRSSNFFVDPSEFVVYSFCRKIFVRGRFKREDVGRIWLESGYRNTYSVNQWQIFVSLKNGKVKLYRGNFADNATMIKMSNYLTKCGYDCSINFSPYDSTSPLK